MATATPRVSYRSPLHEMTQTTPTCLWNDSAAVDELSYAIEHGAVGATCNPVIALSVIRSDLATWAPRLDDLIHQLPVATEDAIAWRLVEELSVRAARLLEPAFAADHGRNGRLSIQTDPRRFRDSDAIVEQAEAFSRLAPNMIVKIPVTRAGIPAIEAATYRGISINATVCFTVAQCIAVAEAVERGLRRREQEGMDIASMGPVCTIMVGRLDDWLKVVMERDGIVVDPGYLEWAGVAVFKKAYQVFRERGYRLRLLSAAIRNHMHWSELIGGGRGDITSVRLAATHQRQRHRRRATHRRARQGRVGRDAALPFPRLPARVFRGCAVRRRVRRLRSDAPHPPSVRRGMRRSERARPGRSAPQP